MAECSHFYSNWIKKNHTGGGVIFVQVTRRLFNSQSDSVAAAVHRSKIVRDSLSFISLIDKPSYLHTITPRHTHTHTRKAKSQAAVEFDAVSDVTGFCDGSLRT